MPVQYLKLSGKDQGKIRNLIDGGSIIFSQVSYVCNFPMWTIEKYKITEPPLKMNSYTLLFASHPQNLKWKFNCTGYGRFYSQLEYAASPFLFLKYSREFYCLIALYITHIKNNNFQSINQPRWAGLDTISNVALNQQLGLLSNRKYGSQTYFQCNNRVRIGKISRFIMLGLPQTW